MPVYFIYGFRWPRPGYTGIRAFTTLNNLDDCSSEYIQNEASKLAILQVFRSQHAHIMQRIEEQDGRTLDFIEQYDPQDESSDSAASQPYVFVAARVVTIADGASGVSNVGREGLKSSADVTPTMTAKDQPAPASSSTASVARESMERPSTTSSHPKPSAVPLCLDVEDVISQGHGLNSSASEAFAELRDKYAEGAKIGWWVVYNGDPERAVSDYEYDTQSEDEDDSSARVDDEAPNTPTQNSPLVGGGGLLGQPLPSLIPPELKGATTVKSGKEAVSRAPDPSITNAKEPMPESLPQQNVQSTEDVVVARPKGSKQGFSNNFSLGRKSAKVPMPVPKGDDVPDTAALKEINKKEGRRFKFFGGRSEKKTT